MLLSYLLGPCKVIVKVIIIDGLSKCQYGTWYIRVTMNSECASLLGAQSLVCSPVSGWMLQSISDHLLFSIYCTSLAFSYWNIAPRVTALDIAKLM